MDQDRFDKAVGFAIAQGFFRELNSPDINQSTDVLGLITLKSATGTPLAKFQSDGDYFKLLGESSANIGVSMTHETKAVVWAKSMGYPVPTKINGCLAGILVVIGLCAAIIPGVLLLVWLFVQENQYKNDMKALVAKWVDAGKPEPGEASKVVTNLERVVEKIETPPSPSATIEERLEELNSMKEKGLVTDEEYQAMRKKILGL